VVILTAGFFTLVGLARAGSILFWAVREDAPSGASGASFKLVGATLALLLASVLMSVFAAPLLRYTAAAAEQLLDRNAYGRAVLGEQGRENADTARPYTGFKEAP
jgi:multicomponent K+:H+ antiporter subunit D